jgi:hypothetical protein
MPSKFETGTIAGVITEWEGHDAPRPSKFKMDMAGEEVELTIWPNDKSQEAIRSYMDMINPDDMVGKQVLATVKLPFTEYQGTHQYNLMKLKVGGTMNLGITGSSLIIVESQPPPQAETQPVLTPRPPGSPITTPAPTATLVPSRTLDPNGKDILIVDQVLYKGVIDRLNNGAALEQAIAESIAAWDGVRARHFVPEEPNEPAPEADDDLGVIDLDAEER